MSNAIYPTLPGLAWDVKRTPQWNTRVQKTVGGSELRASYYSQPIRRYVLSYDVLRASSALQELQSLIGFFNARQGSYDSFLYDDPTDDSVTSHGFGVGDGTTTAFQLQRTLAGPRTLDWQGAMPVYSTPRTNLCPHSEAFASWGLSGASVQAGAGSPAPDGVHWSDQLTANASTGQHQAYQTVATVAGQASFAVCVRNYSWRYVRVILYNATDGEFAYAVVDLNTGAVLFSSGTVAVTAYPNYGWYRIAVTGTATIGNSQAHVMLCDASGNESIATTGVEGVDLFAGQVEMGTPTAYIGPTTTTAVTATPAYWPAQGDGFEPVYNVNAPALTPTIWRQDWQGKQQMYPYARTNLLLNSGIEGTVGSAATSFGIAGTNQMLVATDIASLDPNGHVAKHVRNSSGGADSNCGSQAATVVANGQYVASCWVYIPSAYAGSAPQLGLEGTTTASSPATANLNARDQWQRLVATCTMGAATTLTAVLRLPASGDGQLIYSDAWQVEAGTAATSWIATTSATVTRTDYTLANGLATFAVAPLSGAALTWTGKYFWRCRFEKDMQEFNNFLYQLWEAKSVSFVTVKGA